MFDDHFLLILDPIYVINNLGRISFRRSITHVFGAIRHISYIYIQFDSFECLPQFLSYTKLQIFNFSCLQLAYTGHNRQVLNLYQQMYDLAGLSLYILLCFECFILILLINVWFILTQGLLSVCFDIRLTSYFFCYNESPHCLTVTQSLYKFMQVFWLTSNIVFCYWSLNFNLKFKCVIKMVTFHVLNQALKCSCLLFTFHFEF